MKPSRRTKRLEIRPLRAGDYVRWRAAATAIDSRKKNRWAMKPPASALTRAKFAKLLKRQVNERKLDLFYDFAVVVRKTGEIVGKVALMSVDRGFTQAAYLGWRIWNPRSAWRGASG